MKILSSVSHANVFTQSTWPTAKWGSSPSPPIILVAEAGFVFESQVYPPTREHVYHLKDKPRGHHGYSPDVVDMHTALYAFGPSFTPNLAYHIPSTPYVHRMLERLLHVESGMHLEKPGFVLLLVVIVCLFCCIMVAATVGFLLHRNRNYSLQVDEEIEEKI